MRQHKDKRQYWLLFLCMRGLNKVSTAPGNPGTPGNLLENFELKNLRIIDHT